jgi:hypothetical protein
MIASCVRWDDRGAQTTPEQIAGQETGLRNRDNPATRIVDCWGEKSRSNQKVNVVTSVGEEWNPINDATWKLRHWQ